MAYVYFIQEGSDGPVKIGVADSPDTRLSSLQVGNPRPLRLLAAFLSPNALHDEALLHKRFAADRIRGEWFAPNPDLLARIELEQELEWSQIDAMVARHTARACVSPEDAWTQDLQADLGATATQSLSAEATRSVPVYEGGST